jgi:hypothetical protein
MVKGSFLKGLTAGLSDGKKQDMRQPPEDR